MLSFIVSAWGGNTIKYNTLFSGYKSELKYLNRFPVIAIETKKNKLRTGYNWCKLESNISINAHPSTFSMVLMIVCHPGFGLEKISSARYIVESFIKFKAADYLTWKMHVTWKQAHIQIPDAKQTITCPPLF